MPFIRITVFGPSLAIEQVHRLEQGTTNLMTSIMRKSIEGVSVLVEEIGRGGWSIGNTPARIAAQVEVTIGQDTNSSDEKSRFTFEMMTLLRAVLGQDLPDETYIAIHEFNHESYGRGGLTRAVRDRRRRPAA